MTLSRRHFLALSTLALACTVSAACQRDRAGVRRFAVTMDDFSISSSLRIDPAARNASILAALSKHNHLAAGFVTGSFADSDLGRSIVQSWLEAGHIIGNHSFTHPAASNLSVEEFTADIAKNRDFLAQFPGDHSLFRFPFLDEGDTPEKRDAIRAYLKAEGMKNAAVTLSTTDWYITQRMEERLAKDPDADLTAYRDYYLDHCLRVAEHFHALAGDLGYGNLAHSMLVHHNELNGLFLDDMLTHLKANGWTLVDAAQCFEGPIFSVAPRDLNKGRSVLSVLEQEAVMQGLKGDPEKALEKGRSNMLRPRPETNEMVAANMDALGL